MTRTILLSVVLLCSCTPKPTTLVIPSNGQQRVRLNQCFIVGRSDCEDEKLPLDKLAECVKRKLWWCARSCSVECRSE
jgi:hypothetical protein